MPRITTSTVLVASTPIPAHTLNATPVVRGLLAAGHRVLWYAAAPFGPHIARVGAQHVPFDAPYDHGAVSVARYVSRGTADGLRAVRRLYTEVLVGQAPRQVRDLEAMLLREDVDLLLTDTLLLAGRLLAERQGVRWATIGDGPLLWRDPDTPPFGSGLPFVPGERGRRRNDLVQRSIDRLVFSPALSAYNGVRGDLGLAPVTNLQLAGMSPDLHLQGCSPGLEYPRSPLPGHIRFVGALGPGAGFAPPPPPTLHRHQRSRPLAFVSQGTLRHDAGELALPAARVLVREGFDVLVAAGRRRSTGEPDRFANLAGPGSVTVMPSVDYVEALAQADLFVTNGGYTGVTLAVAAGVPVLQAGGTEEKPDIGARLEWAGVGRSIRRTRPRKQVLRRAVHELMTSPDRIAASRRLAGEMAGYDAPAIGARLVAGLVCAPAP